MANPFDDEDGTFHVLRNHRGEFSLWPTFASVPDGWDIVLDSVARPEASAFVEREWTTLTPEHADRSRQGQLR